MRILLTGASGMIGGELARLWAPIHEVVAGVHASAPPGGIATLPFDLLAPPTVGALVEQSRAEAVVHCAAWANADACEHEPELALRANAEAPALLARACREAGVPLVAFSTDLVLPGDRASTPEIDDPRPVLHYGRTKLEGERAVLREHPDAAVARVALVSGRGHVRPTATESIAWALAAREPVRLFTDQHRTPVDVASVADAVLRMLERRVRGIFNLGGPERVSRLELGQRVAARLGLPPAMELVRQGDLPGAARPADVSLDISRARRELGWEPAALDDSIAAGRRQRQ